MVIFMGPFSAFADRTGKDKGKEKKKGKEAADNLSEELLHERL